MKFLPLLSEDHTLLEMACETAEKLYIHKKQEVASAIRTKSGDVFSAIHFESPTGWATICGEVAAISCMVAAGHKDIDTIIAVWRNEKGEFFVLPPCGRCRELISDFSPNANVIVTTHNDHWHKDAITDLRKISVSDLLPLKPL